MASLPNTLVWPTGCEYAPTKVTWGQVANTLIAVSQFSGSVTTKGLPGERWTLTLELDGYRSDAANKKIESILWKLRGQAGRLALWDHRNPIPMGTYRGFLYVNSAITTGGANSCTIAGGTANGTLKQGDYLSINGELKFLTEDATANGSGVITVNYEPPSRSPITLNAPVRWFQPKTLFILKNADIQVSKQGSQTTSMTLDLIEAWDTAAPGAIVTPDPELVVADPPILATTLTLTPQYSNSLQIVGP